MSRTAVLLAALTLAVAGCGSSKGSPGAGVTAEARHADTAAQATVLTKALARFRATGTGSYESEVTVDEIDQPLAHEIGSYRLRPVAAEFERAILGLDTGSSAPRVQVVRVRSTANAKSFLQLKEWGSWTGCWLKTDLSAITELTGVAVSKGSPLPTAIAVLAKAVVVAEGSGLAGPHLAVDAYRALQFLGVSQSAISAERAALSQVRVPVLLDVTSDGDPSGVAVEGTQISAELTSAGVTLSAAAVNFITKAHARVVLDDLGSPVQVLSPARAELLPRHPAATSTCPANE